MRGRALAALLAARAVVSATGRLRRAAVSGSYNLLAEAAYAILQEPGQWHVDKPCNGSQAFTEMSDTYYFECVSSVRDVRLELEGDLMVLHSPEVAMADEAQNGTVSVDVDVSWARDPFILQVDTTDPLGMPRMYTFDIFRWGSDVSHLSSMVISPKNGTKRDEALGESVGELLLSPDFQWHRTVYSTVVVLGSEFYVHAVAREEHQTPMVGAEMKDQFSTCCVPVDENSLDCPRANWPNEDGRKSQLVSAENVMAVGQYRLDFCLLGLDKFNTFSRYTLKIESRSHYPATLKTVEVRAPGKSREKLASQITKKKYNADLKKHEFTLPDVGLNVAERLGVTEPLQLYVESNDDQAGVSVEDESRGILLSFDKDTNPAARYCDTQGTSTDATCVRGSGTVLFNMTDNEVTSGKKFGDRRLPKWFHTLTVTVVSADGYTQEKYDVVVTQLVSTTAVLKDIRVAHDTPCELTPKFDPTVFEYTCRWAWDICAHKSWSECSNNISIVPFKDDLNCPSCGIIMPDIAYIRLQDTLFMDMRAVLKSNPASWESEREWRIPLVYGEEHTTEIEVLAADRLHSASYLVTYGVDAPWYMTATFSRRLSQTTAGCVLLSAIGNAATMMAITKQIQFMSLTIVVHNVPEQFVEFTQSLKAMTGDLTFLMDVLQLNGVGWFSQKYEEMTANMSFAGLEVDFVGMATEYCFMYEMHGLYGANAFLCYHGATNDFLKSIPNDNKTGGLPTDEWKQIHCKCLYRVPWEDGYDIASTLHEGTDAPCRSLSEIDVARRLSIEEDLDEEEEEDNWYDSPWYWTAMTWATRDKNATADGVTKDTFPDISGYCRDRELHTLVMWILRPLWICTLVIDAFSGPAAEFLGTSITLVFGGMFYYVFYRLFLARNQLRLAVMEPGSVMIFVLTLWLISYTQACCKAIFTKDKIVIQTFEPDQAYVIAACVVGLLVYPVAFFLGVTYRLHRLIQAKEFVWSEEFGIPRWSDNHCQHLQVEQKSLAQEKLGVFPPILNRYVRSCIPVLTRDGDPLMAEAEEGQQEGQENTKSNKNNNGNSNTDALASTLASSASSDSHKHSPRDSTAPTSARTAATDSSEGTGGPAGGHHKQRRVRSREAEGSQETSSHGQVASDSNADGEKARRAIQLKEKLEQEREKAREINEAWKQQAKRLQDLVEQEMRTAEGKDANAAPPWFPEEDPHYTVVGIGNLIRSWKPKKGHPNEFRLDPEETFALLQYTEELQNEEMAMLKYNILSIGLQNGYLKPREPLRDEGEWWLPTEEDYTKEDWTDVDGDNTSGHHPDLEEFGGNNQKYIENALGERLVYKGAGRHWWGKPKGRGTLVWEKEPDSGWLSWEAEQKEQDFASRSRYADKWQWIQSDHWTHPWNIDDIDEAEMHLLHIGGKPMISIKPAELMGARFFLRARKSYLAYVKDQCPDMVSAEQKIEIRKWVYSKLLVCMDMKLKLCWMSSHHPAFARQRTLEEMVKMKYRDVHLELVGDRRNTTAEADMIRTTPHEWINFTIMKIEDTFAEDEAEPWWAKVDAPAEDEIKVMYDEKLFYKRYGDEELTAVTSKYDLVPLEGYYTSPHWNLERTSVGVKRYQIVKPDGSQSHVKIQFDLKHTPLLMTFVRSFKLNTKFYFLDLPEYQNYFLIVQNMESGEQYNWGLEGLTLIMAIMVLSSQEWLLDRGQPGNKVCAATLLAVKTINLLNAMRTNYNAQLEEEEGADEALEQDTMIVAPTDAEIEEEAEKAREEEAKIEARRNARSRRRRGADDRHFIDDDDDDDDDGDEDPEEDEEEIAELPVGAKVMLILSTLKEPDIVTLFAQCLVLQALVYGIHQADYTYTRIAAGLMCITFALLGMVGMAILASGEKLREMIQEQAALIEQTYDQINKLMVSQNRLRMKANDSEMVADLSMVVHDLGQMFKGEVEDPLEASAEEQRAAQVHKKLLYYIHRKTSKNDNSPSSILEFDRFNDIKQSLTISLGTQQMMMCSGIPSVMATVQCVNHLGKPYCSPEMDTYISFFRPEDIDPNKEIPDDVRNKLVTDWSNELAIWMKEDLGAVEMEQTCTKQVRDQITQVLYQNCVGSKTRARMDVQIHRLEMTAKGQFGIKSLDGKYCYVSILSEHATTMVASEPHEFPTPSLSGFGRLRRHEIEDAPHLEYMATFSPDLGGTIHLELPPKMGRFRFFVWVQDNTSEGCVDELVAYSSLVDLTDWLLQNEDKRFAAKSREHNVLLHTLWTTKGGNLEAWAGEDSLVDHVSVVESESEGSNPTGTPDGEHPDDDPAAQRPDGRPLEGRLTRLLKAWCGWDSDSVEATRGNLVVEVRPVGQTAQDEDTWTIRALETLIGGGQSVLSLAKLERYADEWPEFANMFSLRIGKDQLEYLDKHLVTMQEVRDKIWGTPGGEPKTDGAKTLAEKWVLLVESSIRRELAGTKEEPGPEKMDAAIARLQGNVDRLHKRQRTEEAFLNPAPEEGQDPPPFEAPIASYDITIRRVSKARDFRVVDFNKAGKAFQNELLDQVHTFQKKLVDDRSQILHYVVLGTHLKPNNNWRPDPVPPSMGVIVTTQVDEVPEVIVEIGHDYQAKEVVFHQQYIHEGQPKLINGRLCFKANELVIEGASGYSPRSDFSGSEDTPRELEVTYLYADRTGCWIMSPFEGEPCPLGMEPSRDCKFLWVRDNAVTPDKISRTWHRYNKKTAKMRAVTAKKDEKKKKKRPSSAPMLEGSGVLDDQKARTPAYREEEFWVEDTSVKVGLRRARQRGRRARDVDDDASVSSADSVEEGGIRSMRAVLRMISKELKDLFLTGQRKFSEPKTKDCIVGLDASFLTLSWKDFNIEHLVTFRKFLLKEFSSYNCAWEFLTRASELSKNLFTRNLSALLEDTRKKLWELDEAARFAVEGEDEDSEDEEEAAEDPRISPDASASMVIGSSFGIGSLLTLTQAEAAAEVEESTSSAKGEDEHTTWTAIDDRWDDNQRRIVRQYLDKAQAVAGSLAAQGHKIANALDDDDSGTITIFEIEPLYETDEVLEDGDLMQFRRFLAHHPRYRGRKTGLANFWADLSEGMSVDKKQFITAITEKPRYLMHDFLAAAVKGGGGGHGDSTEVDVHAEAEKLWSWLDAHENGELSRNELVPSTGESYEAVDKSLLKFRVPLSHIKEFQLQGNRKIGVMRMQMVRVLAKPEFESVLEDGDGKDTPWAELKKYIDPDWRPQHNKEYLEVCMHDAQFAVWRSVLSDSAMLRPQEWVRHYQGEYKDHTNLAGVYMRHGFGTQAWPNGTYYVGTWADHQYHGSGKLYGSRMHALQGLADPLYQGQWKRGKRNGEGLLRFYQHAVTDKIGHDAEEVGRKFGIEKTYDGQFRDDLFYGEGYLTLKTPIEVCTNEVSKELEMAHLGYMPLFSVDPSHLTDFHGVFKSDYHDTFDWAARNHPIAMRTFPTDGDGKVIKDLNIEKLTKQDQKQKTDLFTKYVAVGDSVLQESGEPMPDLAVAAYRMVGGDTRHIKHGKATYVDGTTYNGQFDHAVPHGEGLMRHGLAEYRGQWSEGTMCGDGKYISSDGMVYKGQWDRGGRSGEGTQRLKPRLQKEYGYSRYSGQWENNVRHGEGVMLFADDTNIYQGEFEDNLRSGRGKLYAVKKWQPDSGRRNKRSTNEDGGASPKPRASRFGRASTSTEASKSPRRRTESQVTTKALAPAASGETVKSITPTASAETAKSSDNVAAPRSSSRGLWRKGGEAPARGQTSEASAGSATTGAVDGPSAGTLAVGRSKRISKSQIRKSMREGQPEEEMPPVPPDLQDLVPPGHYLAIQYNGYFKQDDVEATKYPAWVRLSDPDDLTRGRFYYGCLTSQGKLQGHGTLYSEAAELDPEFMKCVDLGRPYTLEHPSCKKCQGVLACHDGIQTLKYMAYTGQWKNNLPHGTAVQYFNHKGGGVYYGQFVDGKRDGRGTWRKQDGSWTFGPLLDRTTVKNWKNDKMHGCGVVEDKDTIYENVLYSEGKCLLPFTDHGPPATYFEQTRGWQIFFKKSRRRKQKRRGKSHQVNYLGGSRQKLVSMDSYSRHDFENMVSHEDVRALRINHATKIQQAILDGESKTLMREPTDDEIYQEDVLFSGGTGDNAVVNGVYFKCSKSFGHVLYKMVKTVEVEGVFYGTSKVPQIRYLYKDDISQSWNIQPTPLLAPSSAPGTVRSQDDAPDDPASPEEWKVWYHPKRKQLEPGDVVIPEAEKHRKMPVDKIRSQGIIGFMMCNDERPFNGWCVGHDDISRILFIRHPEEFYRRPTFETQDGRLFMYWMKVNGTVAEGSVYVLDYKGIAQDPAQFYAHEGYWCVASKIGESPDKPTRFLQAFIKDKAVTPDQLVQDGDQYWHLLCPDGTFQPQADMWCEMMLRDAGDETSQSEGEEAKDSAAEDPDDAAAAPRAIEAEGTPD